MSVEGCIAGANLAESHSTHKQPTKWQFLWFTHKQVLWNHVDDLNNLFFLWKDFAGSDPTSRWAFLTKVILQISRMSTCIVLTRSVPYHLWLLLNIQYYLFTCWLFLSHREYLDSVITDVYKSSDMDRSTRIVAVICASIITHVQKSIYWWVPMKKTFLNHFKCLNLEFLQ